jgi:hypothetical protein
VPGPGTLRIDFTPSPKAGFEVAAFVSTDRATLFAGPPHAPAANATTLTVTGLANGVQHFVALGVRPTGGGAFQQSGPSLTATPGNPVFVDPAAPAGGDGTTPAMAKNNLLVAVFEAFVTLLGNPNVSVNLWLKQGNYAITSTLPVAAGVNIYGGFGPAFDLATRDVEATPTVWSVTADEGMLHSDEQLNAGLPVIVDGVRMTGNGVGRIGIDSNGSDATPLELRSVVITDMLDRGLRLRNTNDRGHDIVMVNCQSSRNGGDGLSGNGAFDYSVYNCVFASNFQEGLDLNDLSVETGGVARCTITSSQFFGNGAEGLDCTLGAPLIPTNGEFVVRVRGCAFERNRLAGCLIDADFELVSGYSADVVVRESVSRGNSGQGFHLDLDSPLDPNERLTAFVYRVLATSNALDGLYLTSESQPGLVGVSGSALVGNVGAGLRIEGPTAAAGNRAVAVTHSLFASNFGGGMISRDVLASACSSIAYQQASPFDANTEQVGNFSSGDPNALAFVNAPEEYEQVLSRSGAVLTLAAAPSFSIAAKLELANDGAMRSASTIAGALVTLSETPDDFGSPGLLSAFAPSATSVEEDYRLGGGSMAAGQGMNNADAGPFGSAAPGEPGTADVQPLELFYPIASVPAVSSLVGPNDALVITFSNPIGASSANASTVRARRGSNGIVVTLQTSGDQLTILPPGAGWGAGDFRVELDGIVSTTGVPLSGALVLPFRR